MKFEVKNLDDTKRLAKAFAKNLDEKGCFVSLYGDIGAGKTAFVRMVLGELGVVEKVTSPSFVILNEYKGAKFPIYHFDLYRLEYEGLKSIAQELSEYSKFGLLTFVEWAQFGEDFLTHDRLNIKITYPKELSYGENGDPRIFEFEAMGKDIEKFIEIISKDYEAK